MTASEKNTLFYLGLFGVLAYVGWKLWPALRRSLNLSSTGGGAVGAAGATNAAPYDPMYGTPQSSNPLSNLAGSLGLGGGSGAGSNSTLGYGASNSGLAEALDTLLTDGINASDQLALDSDTEVSDVAGDSLDSVPLQNFDVNQLAEPLPTSDGSADSTDYTTYDTNNYDAGQIDDGGGGGGGGGEADSNNEGY